MPSHSLELSFSAVRASTPMKAVEDPSCSIPMDLSRSMQEDSPINLSIRDFDLEDEYRPLNLALAKAPPSVAAASLYSCCPLNLKKDSDEADDGNVPIPEAECGNNKPEFLSTSATIAALRTEQNFQVLAPSKMEGMKGEHTEIAARVSRLLTTPNDQSIYLTTSEILVEESQLVHQLEIKKSPMRSQLACPTYNPSEEDDGCTDPSQMTTVHSQPGPSTLQPVAGLSNFQACAGPSTSCPFAGPSTSQPFVGPSSSQEHTEDCDDDSDDDEDIEIGNVTLLNNFSIREYFEPYLNASVVGCCDVDSNKENLDSQGK